MLHDSRNALYRSPAGAQPCAGEVTLRFHANEGDVVRLRTWTDRETFYAMTPRADDPTLFEVALTLPDKPGLLWYDFHIWSGGQFTWYGNAEDRLGGVGAKVYGDARSYQITVYDPDFSVPEWTSGAVFYQIFPDRFARAEGDTAGRTLRAWREQPWLDIDAETGDNRALDFFGGNLRGIREKLPYLQALGVTALYLNPIFAARTNHRFDTTDWERVDPLLGENEDFTALCEAAGAMGIRVVLDGVFSHSGSAHPFFRHARAAADSEYRSWYRFRAWPDDYKSWWGFKTLPDLNKESPAVLDYFLSKEDAIVPRWLKLGASGWRIDVADELPMPYLREMRRAAGEALLIGEVWEDASNKVSYGSMRSYCLGDTLDGVMNYPLWEAAIDFLLGRDDAEGFSRRMGSLYENYPKPFAQALLNVAGSHDRPRILNILCGRDGNDLPREARGEIRLSPKERALGTRRLKLMLAILVAMPGMPCVYYGDEAGMEGAADPFNRGTFPWGDQDVELTDAFRGLLRLKRTEAALSEGDLALEAPSPDILCIRRGEAMMIVNRGRYARKVRGVRVPAYSSVFVKG